MSRSTREAQMILIDQYDSLRATTSLEHERVRDVQVGIPAAVRTHGLGGDFLGRTGESLERMNLHRRSLRSVVGEPGRGRIR